MFEQSVIANVPRGKRFWTTCLGVTGQAILVTGAVLSPMLWPQVLPPATFTMLVPTAPPGPPPVDKSANAKPQTATRRSGPRRVFDLKALTQPTTMPSKPIRIEDKPEDFGPPTIVGAIYGGGGGNSAGWIPGGIPGVGDPSRAPAPPPAPPSKAPEPKAKPAEIQIVRPGGRVKPPRLVHRVDPPYPPLAKASHIEGVVTMEGIIGIDGRIRSLVVTAGNPLLAPAAVEAVRQWIYEPTQLNENPVEVATTIVVTFTLNR